MKRILLITLLALSTASISGCYKDLIVVDKGYNPSKSTPDYETGRLYIVGYPLGEDINLRQTCPGGAGIVQTKDYFNLPWWTLPFALISYSQQSVYCKGT